MPSKVRTQIQLEPRQYERLKELAHERRQSLSRVLRTIVDDALGLGAGIGADAVRDARLAFVGSGRDAERKRDVARHHDRYLYGARR
jgi:hypothetical protein